MKTSIALLIVLISLSACDVTIIEPVYDARERVIGHYNLEEYSEKYNDVSWYSIQISKSSDGTDVIYIYNFYASDITIYAYLSGDKITIPQQTVNGYQVSGVGTVWGSDITLKYAVHDLYANTTADFCEATLRRN